MFIAAVGATFIILAAPVSSLYRLSDEEYTKMAEYTFATGLPYKGKDFLEWRYGWLGVFFGMLYLGYALLLTAASLFAGAQVKAYFKR